MAEFKHIIALNIQFIAWENFTWPVLKLWIYSLALLVLFLAVCLFLGRVLTHKIQFSNTNEALVLNFAVGSSLLSFLMAFLAFSHLFYLNVLFGIMALSILSAFFFSKERTVTLIEPFHLIFRGFQEEKALYTLFVLNSLPSLLPPYRWDEMSYHLPYVMQWVEQGKITVDPTMRYPLNSFNFHMLQSIGVMLHSVALVHLISWLTGCFACMLVLVFLKRLKVWTPLAYAAALGFYLSPLTQRYLNVACIDVPCMFYLAAAVFGIYLTRSASKFETPLCAASALISAMFVGMRGANFFFIPLFLALAKRAGSWKSWSLFSSIFLSMGTFWYMRNMAIAHDPLPPVFHMFFHKPDPFWTVQDFQAMQLDMTHGVRRDLKSILLLPLRLVTSVENGPLRDWPFQGFMLIFPLSLFVEKKNKEEILITSWSAALFWVIVSPLIRYAHFAALAAMGSALVLDSCVGFFQRKNIFLKFKFLFLVIAIFILIGPNANVVRYFKSNFNRPVPHDERSYAKFYSYLGLPAMRVIQDLKRFGIENTVVYTVGYTHLKYYYQTAGYRLIGDSVNRFRYSDFKRAIEKREDVRFLREAGAKALTIDKNTALGSDISKNILNSSTMNGEYKVLTNDKDSLVIKIT